MRPIRLLRVSIAVVVVFALGGVAWMIHAATRNPDVRARRPGWVEGAFDAAYWLPLILTFAIGCAAVIFVYTRALRRLRSGEDIFAAGFRDRKRRELEAMRAELTGPQQSTGARENVDPAQDHDATS